jgi:ArsR family transcriptional regulator
LSITGLPSPDSTRSSGKPVNTDLARIAKALGHPARIEILQMLLSRKTCIGCDIADQVGLAASTTSEHLRILKDAGLIRGELARPRVCYALAPEAFAPLLQFLLELNQAGSPIPPLHDEDDDVSV